jgi:hypothetical protein
MWGLLPLTHRYSGPRQQHAVMASAGLASTLSAATPHSNSDLAGPVAS